MTGKKRHRVRLSATCRTEISTAFAALFHNRLDNTAFKQARSEELRITAYDFNFIAVIFAILKVDIIAEDFKESCRAIHAFYHCLRFFKRQGGNLIPVVDTSPSVEMLVGCTHRTKPRFYPVRYTRQRAVMQQVGNITPIPRIDLFPSVIDGCLCVRRIFQFDNTKGHTIHVQKHVRTAVFHLPVVCIFHRELINRTEDIIVGVFKVDKRNHFRKPRLRRELNTVHHPPVNLMQSRELAFRTNKTDGIYDLRYFFHRQVGVHLA